LSKPDTEDANRGFVTAQGDPSGDYAESAGAYPKGLEKTKMKPSTQDRTEGKLHEVKGKIKEEVGKVTNDPDLEVSGNAEKTRGTVQKWVGRAEKAIGG
jgi:uncharacterized protein YjbJ (UPF0337 family)